MLLFLRAALSVDRRGPRPFSQKPIAWSRPRATMEKQPLVLWLNYATLPVSTSCLHAVGLLLLTGSALGVPT